MSLSWILIRFICSFQHLFSLDKNNIVSDSIYKHTYSLVADDIKETFVINEVGKGTYIQITVSGKTKASAIKYLEGIEQKISLSDIEKKYINDSILRCSFRNTIATKYTQSLMNSNEISGN